MKNPMLLYDLGPKLFNAYVQSLGMNPQSDGQEFTWRPNSNNEYPSLYVTLPKMKDDSKELFLIFVDMRGPNQQGGVTQVILQNWLPKIEDGFAEHVSESNKIISGFVAGSSGQQFKEHQGSYQNFDVKLHSLDSISLTNNENYEFRNRLHDLENEALKLYGDKRFDWLTKCFVIDRGGVIPIRVRHEEIDERFQVPLRVSETV